MSIEKAISPTLSNLIAEANYTIDSVKEKILAAYNYAVNKEGYTPIEAAKVLRENLTFSKSYIKEVLPLEAKDTSKTKISIQGDEPLAAHHGLNNSGSSENEDFKAFRDNKGSTTTADIKTAYEIKEAESTPIVGEDHNWDIDKVNEYKEIKEGQIPNEIPQHIILQLQQLETLQQQVKELLARNEELQTKLQDKSFEVIQKTKDTVVNGITNLEIKDRIIPVKCSYSMVTERFTVVVDVERARRMGI